MCEVTIKFKRLRKSIYITEGAFNFVPFKDFFPSLYVPCTCSEYAIFCMVPQGILPNWLSRI